MTKPKVKTTIEVLGKTLTRAEAEALYYELQRELKVAELVRTVPIPIPSPAPEPWEPYRTPPWVRPMYTDDPLPLLPTTTICEQQLTLPLEAP